MHQPTAAQTLFASLKTQKIYCSPHMLLVLVVTYIFVAFNDTFWTKGLEVFGGHIGQLILFYAAIFLLTMAFFALFALPYILRPFLAFVLILGAVTSYYMD
ncbi:MAG: phosphoethanolamine transferase domain-containing protein, partial [Albidovulum sp.]